MGTDKFNAGGGVPLRRTNIPSRRGTRNTLDRFLLSLNWDKLRLVGQNGSCVDFKLYFICSFNFNFGLIFSDLNQAKLRISSYFT